MHANNAEHKPSSQQQLTEGKHRTLTSPRMGPNQHVLHGKDSNHNNLHQLLWYVTHICSTGPPYVAPFVKCKAPLEPLGNTHGTVPAVQAASDFIQVHTLAAVPQVVQQYTPPQQTISPDAR